MPCPGPTAEGLFGLRKWPGLASDQNESPFQAGGLAAGPQRGGTGWDCKKPRLAIALIILDGTTLFLSLNMSLKVLKEPGRLLKETQIVWVTGSQQLRSERETGGGESGQTEKAVASTFFDYLFRIHSGERNLSSKMCV